jgi:predicted AAA+ superfamily ATPase
MEQRLGSELHENDTIQETIGLAGRFGLTITYQRPDRKTYLEIVAHYAEEYGLDMDPKQQETRAEAYALRNGGRSPRAAKQFIQLEKGLS